MIMSFLSNLFHFHQSEDSADLTLYAPASGTLLPLSEVPDIVISEKIIGDGVAIMPESETIYAPCDGVIARLLSSKSAFSIRTALGLEVYVSFGIGSIELAGKGFSSEVKIGDTVKKGDPILQVNSAAIANKLKSTVISMIVVRSSGDIEKLTSASGSCVAANTPCVWVNLKHSDEEETTS